MRNLIDKLAKNHTLEKHEYLEIIKNATEADAAYLAEKALAEKKKHYGDEILSAGLSRSATSAKTIATIAASARAIKTVTATDSQKMKYSSAVTWDTSSDFAPLLCKAARTDISPIVCLCL